MPRSNATAPHRRTSAKLELLVVDDDRDFAESLLGALRAQGFGVAAADSLAAARAALAQKCFDAILVDRTLPDGDGVELLRERPREYDTDVIVITGNTSVDSAVDALKQGANDYLTKPLDPARLESTLAHLVRTRALKSELKELRSELVARGRFGSIVGESPAMKALFEEIARVAPTEASVFIQGESGTGKELFAEAIHANSPRRDHPLVPVNCGAISETLIASELFGHERGSFTGAERMHRGFFERAAGGTLFLDEVTEMPARLQVNLLRVIETGMIQRIGGTEQIPVDVRVLAATNCVPEEAIRAGRLREDLYFRLAVFPIIVPPLRERRGDVALLARHFLAQLNDAHDARKEWAPDAITELEKREWKGNVRELKNAVHCAWIMADTTLESDKAIAVSIEETPATSAIQAGMSIDETVRALILATLEKVDGDKREAARRLGISLKTLYNRLNVYNAAKR